VTTGSRASAGTGPSREAAALARNDAYLREFVEALGLCPYAKACREGGRLHRRVLLSRGGKPDTAGFAQAVAEATAAALEIGRPSQDSVEVALLLFPALTPALARGAAGALAFEALCAALREELRLAHERAHAGSAGAAGPPPFYCVAFHPDLPEDLADEHRAVAFIRRSPDPTLQLVRRTVLQAVRGDQGSTFVDTRKLSTEQLLAVVGTRSVSDQIAATNFLTLRREGVEKVRALLAGMRKGGRVARGTVPDDVR
jgi:hypothetical protein